MVWLWPRAPLGFGVVFRGAGGGRSNYNPAVPSPRKLHDKYFKQAKRDGYLARSAYKLLELDDRHKVIPRGGKVLDLGCAPGSWLQVAQERVGPKGLVVGIDLKPVDRSVPEKVVTVVGDSFLSADGGLTLSHYISAFAPAYRLKVLGTSIALATLSTMLALLIGLPYAFFCTRVRTPGRSIFSAIE